MDSADDITPAPSATDRGAASPGQVLAPAPPAPSTVASRRRRPGRIPEIVQTVFTGLILAFIFRAFLVEPFIIPTGSMADALLGAHARLTCPACGWQFAFAPSGDGAPACSSAPAR